MGLQVPCSVRARTFRADAPSSGTDRRTDRGATRFGLPSPFAACARMVPDSETPQRGRPRPRCPRSSIVAFWESPALLWGAVHMVPASFFRRVATHVLQQVSPFPVLRIVAAHQVELPGMNGFNLCIH